ncbi:GNAT family N-acetyltransferase [Listeria grayi]|uniref:GNAT family N-acetyltransferase n=1 Tax=Listeria grayi TaxID=1641 RepID=UPI000F8486AA|nr:GNAT family N-acetyltransferase [Listeria grayi]
MVNVDKTITYRYATQQDVPLIYRYILELAEYEGLADEVNTSEAVLEDSLFNIQAAKVLFPEINGKPIGFCLFFYNFSTFLGRPGLYIEDLYIEEAYRGSGYGKALLEKMRSIAEAEKLGRVEWWCLDENKASIAFYKSQGAVPMEDWTVFRIANPSDNKKKNP